MHHLRSILSTLKTAAPTVALWFLCADCVWAQASGQEGSWPFTGSYAITVLLVTLGILVVCQGGHRADEPPLRNDE
jgi:hypothetical protein